MIKPDNALDSFALMISFLFMLPGDFQGITKYHSDGYVSCWKQCRTDELVDVFCPSGAYEENFSGGFLVSVSLSTTDFVCFIKKIDIYFTQNQVNSF